MNKIWVGVLGLLMVIFLGVVAVYGAEKEETRPPFKPLKQFEKIENLERIKATADFRIDMLHSTRCGCDLPGVDAFYVGDLMVYLSNRGGSTCSATVTLTYHDLIAGPVTITRTTSSLKGYPMNPWALQSFRLLDGPALVKKSIGIRVEIQPVSPAIDPDPSNNVMVRHTCGVWAY